MSENTRPAISLLETMQVIDTLYPWVSSIPNLPSKLRLEEMTDTAPCLTLSQEKGGGKSNFNVLGDYDGELLFSIFYKIDGNDTSSRLSATRTITYIGAWVENKTTNKDLPELTGNNTCTSIAMIDTPAMVGREENGHEVYGALFSLTYRHKNTL